MKITHKRELQQIAFNHLSYIDFQDIRNFYTICTAKQYSSLVNDTAFASDNHLRFICNLLERIQKLITTIDNKTRDGKLQHDTNRVAKPLALSSGKTDKSGCLIDEEIFSSDNGRCIS